MQYLLNQNEYDEMLQIRERFAQYEHDHENDAPVMISGEQLGSRLAQVSERVQNQLLAHEQLVHDGVFETVKCQHCADLKWLESFIRELAHGDFTRGDLILNSWTSSVLKLRQFFSPDEQGRGIMSGAPDMNDLPNFEVGADRPANVLRTHPVHEVSIHKKDVFGHVTSRTTVQPLPPTAPQSLDPHSMYKFMDRRQQGGTPMQAECDKCHEAFTIIEHNFPAGIVVLGEILWHEPCANLKLIANYIDQEVDVHTQPGQLVRSGT